MVRRVQGGAEPSDGEGDGSGTVETLSSFGPCSLENADLRRHFDVFSDLDGFHLGLKSRRRLMSRNGQTSFLRGIRLNFVESNATLLTHVKSEAKAGRNTLFTDFLCYKAIQRSITL